MRKSRPAYFRFWICILFCFSVLHCTENLLVEDPFYKETLPKLLGEHFQPRGTYRVAFYTQPAQFHPFSNDPLVSSLWSLCTGSLAQLQFGRYQTMAPALASRIERIEKAKGVDYKVTLRPNLYWSPLNSQSFGSLHSRFTKKEKVRPEDFKLYLDLIKNPYNELPLAVSQRELYKDLESIEVLNEHSFIVHWSREGRFDLDDLTGQLRPIPAHVYLFSKEGESFIEKMGPHLSEAALASFVTHHWAQKTVMSCGPWEMADSSQEKITLRRNSHYPEPYQALFEKIQFYHKLSPNTAWQAFKLNQIDSIYLTPFQWQNYQSFLESDLYKKQQKKGLGVKKLEFSTKLYYFIGWNQKKELFQSKEVRRALSHALDCSQITSHFLKGFGKPLTGPYMPESSSYNTSLKPLNKNTKLSISLLEKQGWFLKEPLGTRTHTLSDETFKFKLMYYFKNDLAQSICQYIAASFKEIGVECVLEGVDYPEFMERFYKKDFDAIYMAWALAAPPEDLYSTWSSQEADLLGSNNIISFKNSRVDYELEQLKKCKDLEKRKQSYHKIHEVLYEEQPYTFLYVPQQIFLHRENLGGVFVPKSHPDWIQNADIAEPSLKTFYFKEEL